MTSPPQPPVASSSGDGRVRPCMTVTEIGTERRCNSCDEWWPMDGEFYHRNSRGIGGFLGTCRACFAERRNRRDLTRRETGRATVSLLRALRVAD